MYTNSASRISVRFVAVITAVSLILSAFPASFFVAFAQEETNPAPTETPVVEAVTEEVVTEDPVTEEAPVSEVVEEQVEETENQPAEPLFAKIAAAEFVSVSDTVADMDELFTQCVSEGNLIANGSFETPGLDAEGFGWDVVASGATGLAWVVEWITSVVGAPDPAKLEIQHSAVAHNAFNGVQYAELDSNWNNAPGGPYNGEDARVKISQEIVTTPGSTYRVAFAFSPLPNTDATNNVLKVLVNGTEVMLPISADGTANVDTNWEVHYYDFVADSNVATIAFADAGASDTFGTLVDDIRAVECERVTETGHTISGYKYNDINGNREKDVEETAVVAGWVMELRDGENTVVATTTTDANGRYSFTGLEDGEWYVTEQMQEGWDQSYVLRNGEYQVESSGCSFYFGEEQPSKKSLSRLTDSGTCDFGNHYFFETITVCKMDESESPVAGWNVMISSPGIEDGDYYVAPIVHQLVTGEDGCVSKDVDPYDGPWYVSEESREGWSQIGAYAEFGDVYAQKDETQACAFFDYRASRSEVSAVVIDPEYRCTFVNDRPEEVNNGGSSSSGTRTKRPRGQVLGASTQCGLWLEDYMQKSSQNDSYQVLKLQVFLTLQGFATPLTGIYDATTEANVKKFQSKYFDEVIKPWFERGIVPHNRPTGFVYKTTRWKINDIMCPGIEAYPSLEGENLTTNVLVR